MQRQNPESKLKRDLCLEALRSHRGEKYGNNTEYISDLQHDEKTWQSMIRRYYKECPNRIAIVVLNKRNERHGKSVCPLN